MGNHRPVTPEIASLAMQEAKDIEQRFLRLNAQLEGFRKTYSHVWESREKPDAKLAFESMRKHTNAVIDSASTFNTTLEEYYGIQ